jgi:hypothetical protein
MYRVSQNKELDKKISLLEEQLSRKRVVFFFFKLKQKKSKRDLLQKQIDKLYDKILKPVRMDTTYKRSCVTWAKNTSDSVVNYRVTLKHTKTYGRYSEVITGGGFGCNLNDSVSKFSVFVKKVCGKSLKGLSNVELLALASLYS